MSANLAVGVERRRDALGHPVQRHVREDGVQRRIIVCPREELFANPMPDSAHTPSQGGITHVPGEQGNRAAGERNAERGGLRAVLHRIPAAPGLELGRARDAPLFSGRELLDRSEPRIREQKGAEVHCAPFGR